MQRVKKEMVWERVIKGIIEYIVQNGLHPGDKLPTEREFCDLFFVGRPAVREALSALSVLRIVDIVQGDGIYFSDMNGASIANSFKLYFDLGIISASSLFEARILFESDAAELAAQRITPKQVALFTRYIEESAQCLDSSKKFSVIDSQIHQLIYEACGNPVIASTMASINELVDRTRVVTSQYVEIRQVSHDYHEKIYFAIKNGEAMKARKYMGEHLLAVKKAADLHKAFYSTEISNLFRQEFNLK